MGKGPAVLLFAPRLSRSGNGEIMGFFFFLLWNLVTFPLGFSTYWDLLAAFHVIPLCVLFQIRTAKPHDAQDSRGAA